VSLLHENGGENHMAAGAELRNNSRRLAETLASFGVDAKAGDVIHGPSVTRYEFTLDQGVKLSKITNLQDDIALALGASGVRIAAVPNKISVVGIEVPNKTVTPVLIRDVIESRDFMEHPSKTAFALGRDIGGRNIIGNIEKLPHVLIAGTTGSGKSVCTNSLIISLLYKSTPDEVRFIMVDPKMVELAPYNGIPHLLIPVVTDPKKAAGALQWAVFEMMKRYKTFSENGVKKLEEYNKLAAVREDDGSYTPKMKLSESAEKMTIPCLKKVWRIYDQDGKAMADLITMADEVVETQHGITLFDPIETWKECTYVNCTARCLSTPIYENGKRVYSSPSLDDIKKFCKAQVNTLWDEVKRFENPHRYYVDLSQKLWDTRSALLKKLSK